MTLESVQIFFIAFWLILIIINSAILGEALAALRLAKEDKLTGGILFSAKNHVSISVLDMLTLICLLALSSMSLITTLVGVDFGGYRLLVGVLMSLFYGGRLYVRHKFIQGMYK